MSQENHDLATRVDVERLVDAFYQRVRNDEILSPIFDDVAQVNWSDHLPKMYDFWETVLFGSARYQGNPLAVHLALGRKVALGEQEFARWLALFQETVDTLFVGRRATEAVLKASRIAAVMRHNLATDRDGETSPFRFAVTPRGVHGM